MVRAFLLPSNGWCLVAADLDKPALHHGHRCDACGSRAYVHVVFLVGLDGAGELFFCGHHARKHLPAIKASGRVRHLIDETRLLQEHIKPPEPTELLGPKK